MQRTAGSGTTSTHSMTAPLSTSSYESRNDRIMEERRYGGYDASPSDEIRDAAVVLRHDSPQQNDMTSEQQQQFHTGSNSRGRHHQKSLIPRCGSQRQRRLSTREEDSNSARQPQYIDQRDDRQEIPSDEWEEDPRRINQLSVQRQQYSHRDQPPHCSQTVTYEEKFMGQKEHSPETSFSNNDRSQQEETQGARSFLHPKYYNNKNDEYENDDSTSVVASIVAENNILFDLVRRRKYNLALQRLQYFPEEACVPAPSSSAGSSGASTVNDGNPFARSQPC